MSRDTAYAAAAYCYAAVRYRSRKVAEAPLMVVKEDRRSGDYEWLDAHPLAERLDDPSPDFDMAELLARTQVYLDITGSALWVKDADQLGGLGRLTPFHGSEFTVRQTRQLIRGEFVITTNGSEETLPAARCIYFHELNPADWHTGTSLVDVVLGWLNLSTAARSTVRDLLGNALFPPVIIQADPTWNPDQDTFKEYQRGIEQYANPGNKGKPLVMLGGGSATVTSQRLKDLIPGDILDRVESVVSAVFGVPAVVLQFLVGLQNSPWSQMAEARRMCYEDTIEPLWKEYESRLTRQLLRAPLRSGGAPLDDDRTHSIRFDTSKVRGLQIDKSLQSQIAERIAPFSSINERRALVQLEPAEGEEYDEVPGKPAPAPAFGAPAGENEEGEADEAEEGEDEKAARTKRESKALDLKNLHWALFDESARSQELMWQLAVTRRIEEDRAAVAAIIERAGKSAAGPTERKDPPPPFGPADPEAVRRMIREITEHMDLESAVKWRAAVEPLISQGGRRAVERLVAQLGLSFDLLQPGLTDYTEREAAWLVTQVTDTTKQAIRDSLSAGLLEGESVPDLAKRIQESGTFARSRAELIARTESTRVTNGAAVESLQTYQRENGGTFKKEWLTANDSRVRDEHAAINGERVDLNAKFSNGLTAPGEPNCRCTVLTIMED